MKLKVYNLKTHVWDTVYEGHDVRIETESGNSFDVTPVSEQWGDDTALRVSTTDGRISVIPQASNVVIVKPL